MLLDFFTIAATFTVAIVSTLETENGELQFRLRRVSIPRKILIVIAVASFILSIYQSIEKNKKSRELQQVSQIPYEKIEHIISSRIVGVLVLFHIEISPHTKIDSSKIYEDMPYFTSTMESSFGSYFYTPGRQVPNLSLRKIQDVTYALNYNGRTWAEIFSTEFGLAKREIQEVISLYGMHIDPSVKLILPKMLDSEAMIFATESIPVFLKESPSDSFMYWLGYEDLASVLMTRPDGSDSFFDIVSSVLTEIYKTRKKCCSK